MESQPFSKVCRASILVGTTLSGVLGTSVNVRAQALKDVQTPDAPLVLKAQGSFFVGGEKVEQTQVSWATSALAGTSPSIKCTCATWCRRAAMATCRW